ncbi:MAG: FAD-dependent oxidoreductase [Cyanobacteria bacterium P01_F01_bin.150]
MLYSAHHQDSSQKATLLVVGSGITGLMTAYQAALAGYSVKIVSKSPDPRSAKAGTRFESSTWDGYVNRYITLTEGHPYLDLPGYITTMYPGIDTDFQQAISQGGMLVHPREKWNALNQEFLAERDRANANHDEILTLFHEYIDENRASMASWYRLLTNAIKKNPELAAKISLHSHGIDRFYDEASLFEGATHTQRVQNIVKKSYSPQELLADPSFQIYASGLSQEPFIEGGGLTMYGLAFDIQALCREWLFPELESHGVELCLGPAYDVVEIVRDAQGYVVGVKTANGELHGAKHLILHPGAYMDPNVLKGTEAHGKLAGVKGLWMRVKQAEKLFGDAPRPNKIHGGRYAVEMDGHTYTGQICDLNVMPKHNADGSWELVIGSGYLFVGTYPFEGDAIMGQPLPDAVKEGDRQTQIQFVEELAIRAFAQVVSRVYDLDIDMDAVLAGTHDYIDLPSNGCVRSWTPDDKELRVLMPTVAGGMAIIDGGGNTGSTTKAPFVSQSMIRFTQAIDKTVKPMEMGQEVLQTFYEDIRASLRRTVDDLPKSRWQELEDALNAAVEATRAVRAIALF